MRTKTETQKRKNVANTIIIALCLALVAYIAKGCYDNNLAEKKEAAAKEYRMNMRKKYSIINEEKVGTTTKISIDIDLKQRLNKVELEELGKFIKEEEAKYFKIAYIGYYLEELGYSNGYWATTHYTPTMQVWISNK